MSLRAKTSLARFDSSRAFSLVKLPVAKVSSVPFFSHYPLKFRKVVKVNAFSSSKNINFSEIEFIRMGFKRELACAWDCIN